jgi:hypothetical protein
MCRRSLPDLDISFKTQRKLLASLTFGHVLGTDENGFRILLIQKPDIWCGEGDLNPDPLPDGFVIAADGRVLNKQTGAIATDTEQKILPLHHESGEIGCSMAGVGWISSRGRILKFGAEVLRAARSNRDTTCTKSLPLFGHLAGVLNEWFESLDRRVIGTGGDSATRLYLDGFFGGRPSRTKILFEHSTPGAEPEMNCWPPPSRRRSLRSPRRCATTGGHWRIRPKAGTATR